MPAAGIRSVAKITLRRGAVGDATALSAIAIEVYLKTYLSAGVAPAFADYVFETYAPEKMRTALEAPDELFCVAESEHGLQGFVRAALNTPAPDQPDVTTEISTLYVRPHLHRKGIGKALMEAIAQLCEHENAGPVWLVANADNLPAIAFYEAIGFQESGVTDYEIGGVLHAHKVFLAVSGSKSN